jgi:hypothetical protein
MGGVNLPGLLSVMLILVIAFAPVLFGRRGPASEQDDGESDDGGGGPGGPKPPSRPPDPSPGGIPLDDARPARVRLRAHERLVEGRRIGERRRSREPDHVPAVVDRPTPRS